MNPRKLIGQVAGAFIGVTGLLYLYNDPSGAAQAWARMFVGLGSLLGQIPSVVVK
jgi:hypothetical protein